MNRLQMIQQLQSEIADITELQKREIAEDPNNIACILAINAASIAARIRVINKLLSRSDFEFETQFDYAYKVAYDVLYADAERIM